MNISSLSQTELLHVIELLYQEWSSASAKCRLALLMSTNKTRTSLSGKACWLTAEDLEDTSSLLEEESRIRSRLMAALRRAHQLREG